MRLLVWLLAAGSLAAQDPVDFRGWLNRGVQEFKAGNYPAAVAAFERAVAIDPSEVSGQLYLGTAYMDRFIPGAESPENRRFAELAQARFLKVLEIDGANTVAIASLASLMLNQKKWDDALQWYEKLAAIEPGNADAYYSMGFIAWSRWYPAYSAARSALGMRQETPGPIQDAGVRGDLAARFGPVIEAGLRSLQKALEINPQFDDAMAYMNLLIRERADLLTTTEEYKREIAIADEWVMKALATKKAKAERRAATIVVGPPPPPLPPPPPPPSGNRGPTPQRISISGPGTVGPPRTREVAPVYPALAKEAGIQGEVRFNVVIDKLGHPLNITVISGHPLLIPAALEAVKQWEWRPTLLNGQPVEVATEVSVPFVM